MDGARCQDHFLVGCDILALAACPWRIGTVSRVQRKFFRQPHLASGPATVDENGMAGNERSGG